MHTNEADVSSLCARVRFLYSYLRATFGAFYLRFLVNVYASGTVAASRAFTHFAIFKLYPSECDGNFICTKIVSLRFPVRVEYFSLESRGGVGKSARVVNWSLPWLCFFFDSFLKFFFCKCLKPNIAVWKIFTPANMFCSNYLFQIDNDFFLNCSNGGIVWDVFRNEEFQGDLLMYWFQVRKLNILPSLGNILQKSNPPNSDVFKPRRL